MSVEWIDLQHDERINDNSPDLAAWWTVFNDPTLNQLIETAYRQNLSVREAGTRILQARAIRNISVGNLFPQSQTMTGEYAHIQSSREVAVPSPLHTFDNWDVGFNLSWELDFWGRFRRAIEAADAELDASVANYDDVLVLLLSDVAANYVQVRTFQKRLQVARENIDAQGGSYNIADTKFRSGATSNLDVEEALTNLRQTESIVPALENGLRVANNRLCVLLGIPPRDLTAEWPQATIPKVPPQVSVGIPAELLRRRPDVRRAERRVAAQSARIGVAEAELYPRFSLNGVIHWEAEDFDDMFNLSDSMSGLTGASFVWKILNYGRLRNGVRLEQARFDGLVYNYRQTVLQAQEEVENGIVGMLTSQDQYAKLSASVAASSAAQSTAETQYQAGATDFNRIFVIQSTRASLQDQAALVEGNIPLSLIATYRALGGGWQIRCRRTAAVQPAETATTEELPGPTAPTGTDDPLPLPEPPSSDEPSPIALPKP